MEKETSLNVFTTWELSFKQLHLQTSKDGTATKLLTLFAFFDNKDISERLFAMFQQIESWHPETFKLLAWLRNFTDSNLDWDVERFRDVLIILKDLSLLQMLTKETDGFCHSSMHPLVKDWIRLRTERSICQENSLIVTSLIESVLANAYRRESGMFDLPLSVRQDLITHIIAQNENCEEYLASSSEFHGDDLESQHWFVDFLS